MQKGRKIIDSSWEYFDLVSCNKSVQSISRPVVQRKSCLEHCQCKYTPFFITIICNIIMIFTRFPSRRFVFNDGGPSSTLFFISVDIFMNCLHYILSGKLYLIINSQVIKRDISE